MNTPLVSIIMTTYNEEKYVVEAIESVLAQTYENWELIIIDDGSTDGTLAITEQYEKQDSRIRRDFTSNLGVAEAVRAEKLHLAKGDYITFLDGDDYLPETSISDRMTCLIEQPRLVAVTGHSLEIRSSFKEPKKVLSVSVFSISTFADRQVPHQNTRYLYRKECFSTVDFNQPYVMGDGVFTYLLIKHYGEKIAAIDKVVYYYRIHEESMIRSANTAEKRIAGAKGAVSTLSDNLSSDKKEFLKTKRFIINTYLLPQFCFNNRFIREDRFYQLVLFSQSCMKAKLIAYIDFLELIVRGFVFIYIAECFPFLYKGLRYFYRLCGSLLKK